MSKDNELVFKDENAKHDYCSKTLEMEEGARLIYLILGERLYHIREQRLYEPQWSSWIEYCLEFKDLSTSGISKMITVYEKLVLELGFKPSELVKAGGWTKLYAIAQIIKDKKEADHWLHLASTLSRTHLMAEITEKTKGVEMAKCQHKNTYKVEICEDCGHKERIY